MSSQVYLGPLALLAGGALCIVGLRLHPRTRGVSVIAFLPLLVVVAAGQLALNRWRTHVGDAVSALLVIVFVVGAVVTARRRSQPP